MIPNLKYLIVVQTPTKTGQAYIAGRVFPGFWVFFIMVVTMMYRADFRTYLMILSYTDPLDGDRDVAQSRKLILHYGLDNAILRDIISDELGGAEVYRTM